MANRTELGGTTLHYLSVRQAMVSIHRPVQLKILLTCSITWQTDCCTPRTMASKALLNIKEARLCSSLFCAYCSKITARTSPYQNTATFTATTYTCTCVGTLTIQLRSIKSFLPSLHALHHSRDKLFQALSRCSILHVRELVGASEWDNQK